MVGRALYKGRRSFTGRIVVYVLMLCILTGCSSSGAGNSAGTDSTPAAKVTNEPKKATSTPIPTPTEVPIEDIPEVVYSDCVDGAYDNKKVTITVMLDNLEYVEIGTYKVVNFDAWILDKRDKYIIKDYETVSDDKLVNLLKNAQNGDFYKFTLKVSRTQGVVSFGFHDAISAQKIDPLTTKEKAIKTFTKACATVAVKDIERNPDDYFYSKVAFKGEVFQLAKEDGDWLEFLLDTGEDDPVYVVYMKHEGESRILEGDKITVYGYCYKLYSYNSVLGTKMTVPKVGAMVIEY